MRRAPTGGDSTDCGCFGSGLSQLQCFDVRKELE